MAERIIPEQRYDTGDRKFDRASEILDIARGDTVIKVVLTNTVPWDPDARKRAMEFWVEISFDGGTSWEFSMGGACPAQQKLNERGEVMRPSLQKGLRDVGNPNRKARIRVANMSPITTEIQLRSF